jgi:hypothetical protein
MCRRKSAKKAVKREKLNQIKPNKRRRMRGELPHEAGDRHLTRIASVHDKKIIVV